MNPVASQSPRALPAPTLTRSASSPQLTHELAPREVLQQQAIALLQPAAAPSPAPAAPEASNAAAAQRAKFDAANKLVSDLRAMPAYMPEVRAIADRLVRGYAEAIDYAAQHKPHAFLPGAKRRRQHVEEMLRDELVAAAEAAVQAALAHQQCILAQHPDWDATGVGNQMGYDLGQLLSSDPRTIAARRQCFAKYPESEISLTVTYTASNRWKWKVSVDL